MDKPVADKLNPAHDAAVRRMLAAAAHPPTAEEARHFNQMAQVSLDEQQEIERTQTGDFAEFIAAYQSSTLCKDCA